MLFCVLDLKTRTTYLQSDYAVMLWPKQLLLYASYQLSEQFEKTDGSL